MSHPICGPGAPKGVGYTVASLQQEFVITLILVETRASSPQIAVYKSGNACIIFITKVLLLLLRLLTTSPSP